MRLLLVIETPEDDAPHAPRVRQALWEYERRVMLNHHLVYTRRNTIDKIGLDGGPNAMECENECRVTEMRIDAPRYFWRALKFFFRRAT